jgi:hypothetical protein
MFFDFKKPTSEKFASFGALSQITTVVKDCFRTFRGRFQGAVLQLYFTML